MIKKNKKWFSLIEIIVWLVLFAIVVTFWVYAIGRLGIGRIKLIDSTNIETQAIYFSERLFEMIKKWWVIDYEEYFNRKVINLWQPTIYQSWHYLLNTGFWNFWSWWKVGSFSSSDYGDRFYYCISWNAANTRVGTGCFDNNLNNYKDNVIWKPQRYWQYYFQFIDFNGNYDSDEWDEDLDWAFIWDDDDEYIGVGPSAFTWGENVHEIYLISWDKKLRTYFRWNVRLDPDRRPWNDCDFTNPENPTWTGCLGTIEFLKLEWKDHWKLHAPTNINSSWAYDWIIDTWVYHRDFPSWWEIAGTGWVNVSTGHRIPLFSDEINVRDVVFMLYPDTDPNNAWKEVSEVGLWPYLRIHMTLTPSWKRRNRMKWKIPEIKISTTIALTDIFSK